MSGQLVSDPLFVGLTRPSMIFGVSIQYAMLNLMVSVTMFIQKSSIYIIFIALVVHMIGYYFALKNHVLWSFILIIVASVINVLISLFGEPIPIAYNW